MADNLWPTDFGEINKKPPIGILREQAQALGERTANIVTGRVSTTATVDGKMRPIFSLWCSPLGYTTNLHHIDHGIDLYPVDVFVDWQPGPITAAKSEDDFIKLLRDVCSSPQAKKTIASLLAQSKQ